jgi:hypothetical protein
MTASASAPSFNSINSTPRRGVLRPPSVSSFGTSLGGRSRAGSTAGSSRREQERDFQPELQPPPPRLPRQQRAAPQSYASNDSGTRSRPATPPENYSPARPRRQPPPQPSSNYSPPTTPRPPVRPGRDSERSSQTERERLSQADKERASQFEARPLQPTIVIPPAVRDPAPSPRVRTPAQPSPQNQSTPRLAPKTTLRPPSPPLLTPTPSTLQPPKRDPHARVSYFDPTNQAVSERLLDEGIVGDTGESALGNVEDMLEGFEWQLRSGSGSGGAADQIEARLKDELLALEKVCLCM